MQLSATVHLGIEYSMVCHFCVDQPLLENGLFLKREGMITRGLTILFLIVWGWFFAICTGMQSIVKKKEVFNIITNVSRAFISHLAFLK